MANGKVHVSYVAFVVYIVSILLISLLIALLTSLVGVKRTGCPTTAPNRVNIEPENIISKFEHLKIEKTEHLHKANTRAKKNVDARKTIREKAAKDEFIKMRFGDKLSKKSNDDCEEFLIYQNGQYWENSRLPDYVVPTRYDLEIYTPRFDLDVYAGINKILIDLYNDTKYVIFHSTKVDIVSGSLKDKNGNDIPIKCGGYYPFNDYYVIIAENVISKDNAPLSLEVDFIGLLSESEQGIFDVSYDGGNSKKMLTSHFQPIDARSAFPCFDEPSFKTVLSLTVDHPKGTIAVSNMPPVDEEPAERSNDTIRTIFQDTPKLPTYFYAITVFDSSDFSNVSVVSSEGKKINLWARNKYINNGFGDAPAEMAMNIYNAIEYFWDVDDEIKGTGPEIINMIAVPDYRESSIAHWGIPIFQETKLLFKSSTTTEAAKQNIALLIAKTFAEFWFGNYVTFKWWDELWLQEGLGDYFKYKFVDRAYQEWRINEQFITEELINVLVSDAYPSSHPVVKPIYFFYEIEQLFDDVESSKVAAVLRMMEYEIGQDFFLQDIYNYLAFYAWQNGESHYLFQQMRNVRDWSAKAFTDRWFLQSNYPSLSVTLIMNSTDNKQYLSVVQDRNLNSEESIFGLDVLYPSPFDFTWFVPLKCAFGESTTDNQLEYLTFDVEEKRSSFALPKIYQWVHCDEFFTGYYMLDYTRGNWRALAEVLKQPNTVFLPLDRANIIHNGFMNAFSEKEVYADLVNILYYLRTETDYIPWKTVSKHVKDMTDIIQYRPSFYSVSNFFNFEIRFYENNFDLWSATNDHVEQLTKSTLLELACRMQDFQCLTNTSTLWPTLYESILSDTENTIPIHVRPVVYNYHFQNTYSIRDWDFTFLKYETTNDPQEQERLLEALTYTRLPSQLARFLESQRTGGLKDIDFLDAVFYFAETPLGRELIWNFYRSNFEALVDEYSIDSPVLGQLLLEIVKTFEDEYLFFELVKFIVYTPTGASLNAKFKALELVSTTVVWLLDKEEEIEHAFSPFGIKSRLPEREHESKFEISEFKRKAKEFLDQSKEFKELKKQFLSRNKY